MDGNLDFDIINCAKEDVQSHSTMQSHSTKNVLLIIIRTNIMSEDVQPCSLRLFYEGLKHCMDTCARFISENSTGKVEECKYCIEMGNGQKTGKVGYPFLLFSSYIFLCIGCLNLA